MSAKHVVKQGEHLTGIAVVHGFGDYRVLWNFPENAELKKKRKDPHILFAGDVVAIPQPRPKTVSKPAGAAHDFVLAATQLRVELRLLDPFSKPIANAPCQERTDDRGDDGKPTGAVIGDTLTTDKDGRTGFNIKSTAIDSELKVFVSTPLPPPVPLPAVRDKFDLIIGGLDPVAERAGVRGRLNNLGYFAGIGDGPEDREQLFWAIEEFQFDNKLTEAKRDGTKLPNGDLDDASNTLNGKTRAKLVEVHGDKEPL